jgi:protein-L-isoaspartate(D-aspartate) O-methyltransferase
MHTPEQLTALRVAYAQKMTADAPDSAVEAAFASVHREDFLGKGPWPIFVGMNHYVATPDSDPSHLYADVLVGIVPERGINNGQPSWHAFLLGRAKPRPGDHVVHIGVGSGYYTAIMAHMVGPSGRVTGIEFDQDLASLASANLASHANVRVVHGEGTTAAFDTANVIYVNAGATRPADSWLDRLANHGRLLVPFTTSEGFSIPDDGNFSSRGAVFLIERDNEEFHATWISPVAVFPCAGSRDEMSERALCRALQSGRWHEVTRLYRTGDIADERAFLKAPDWCLAYH